MRLGDSPLLRISISGRKSNENKAIGLVTMYVCSTLKFENFDQKIN